MSIILRMLAIRSRPFNTGFTVCLHGISIETLHGGANPHHSTKPRIMRMEEQLPRVQYCRGLKDMYRKRTSCMGFAF